MSLAPAVRVGAASLNQTVGDWRGNTERIIRDETSRARVRLQQDAAELAVKIAEELLQARMTGDDQSRLAREFLDVVNQDANKETVAHG